eukprot:TRINITY_DN745_c0_g1_i1.p2 TRINITY_DN745_c0_g1~~TRINITY_DN745_c0_g1_i1.p2  ORF type:complete len:572 (+),score=170.12 TRINITY_DN745_c0_g1_i1:101-1717(+)
MDGGRAVGAAALVGSAAAATAAVTCVRQLHDSWVVSRPFSSVAEAVEAFRRGSPVVVMDDEDRENEGDIIAPAHCVTEQIVTLMVNHTTGILCAPMPAARADALQLAPMLTSNQDPKGTAFTVTCDAKGRGVTTGVSSHDRVATFRALADPTCGAGDITRPGHIFPLRARPGGVLSRRGHTEATVDLCQLAGVEPAVGVIGELVLADGTMMRRDDCKRFAYSHGMPIITIDALAQHLAAATPMLRSPAGELLADAEVVSRPFASVEEAISAFRSGKGAVVMDDEDRENEGDIIVPAALISEETMTLMVNHTTGILCAPMPDARADALQLPLMVGQNEDPKRTAFTVTCDAKGRGVTTGVSSHDRVATFRALSDPATTPADLTRPGHIFPLRARRGGVLTRRGHTEATVDLCELAGLEPAVGVIGELVRPDGAMMRRDDCKRFAFVNGLPVITIEALAEHLRELRRGPPAAAQQYPAPVVARMDFAAGPPRAPVAVNMRTGAAQERNTSPSVCGLTPSPYPAARPCSRGSEASSEDLCN